MTSLFKRKLDISMEYRHRGTDIFGCQNIKNTREKNGIYGRLFAKGHMAILNFKRFTHSNKFSTFGISNFSESWSQCWSSFFGWCLIFYFNILASVSVDLVLWCVFRVDRLVWTNRNQFHRFWCSDRIGTQHHMIREITSSKVTV